MIDQDAVRARVVALVERTGRKLYDLKPWELDLWIEIAFKRLLAETPVYPRANPPADAEALR